MARKPAGAATPAPAVASPVGARGEISIILEGAIYPLRPSFQAIGAIETTTGLTLWELAANATGRQLSLSQAQEIVAECIRAYARATGDQDMMRVKSERIGALIYAEPGGLLAAVTTTIKPLLLLALHGAYSASGEAKA